ncbi:leucyl/phenylalanyl-tRNA--protein transferase [Qipengyuania marisflavi]|uniref:Leucyl/phenylalanyl-tRNA--protein transferase n=1 Tax=Qipengyuania marisflavi TaxID=2486356 RepID=A0A5S3P025_9SPHN|nr:leucyl/phenylalanyl-tRNA--protein transferase [Qipengyuania marisflavi]TMM46142.1 leucyl/phenylalanyl-tRNA--protein transferase [Qipengyuania marisflavi]
MLYQLSYTPMAKAERISMLRRRWQAAYRRAPQGAKADAVMHAPAPEIIPAELLLRAYRSGIFPMADHRDDPDVYWVEPRERGIIPLDGFRVSQSLRKQLRQNRFRVSCDEAFDAVIAECAQPREELAESWISRRIETSYRALHRSGHAHSIECWHDGELVGGLYGVAFARVFCGESMFSRRTNASKIALAWLVAAMRRAGYALLDCQFMTDHLASMGAAAIPQAEYMDRLQAASGSPLCTLPNAFSGFYSEAGALGASSSPGKVIAHSLIQTS